MTITPNIFKIDREHHLLKPLTTTIAIIKVLIRDAYRRAEWELDEGDLEIQPYKRDSLTYYLYLYTIADKQSEWATFLPEEIKQGKNKFQQTKLSLILFVETENELFAIVGGGGYRIIVNFIDHSYGLMTYDRLINLTEDEATSTKSRGITGQRIGMSEQFRDQYKMVNYLQFGKIPKELHVKLAESTTSDYFTFLLGKYNERLNITVGNGFKINKQVNFEVLHEIIKELNNLLEIPAKELLSSYTQVRDKNEIDELQKALNKRIFNHIPFLLGTSRDERDNFEFDLASPNNIEAFYEAESYQLKEKIDDKHILFDTVFHRDEIYKTVVLKAYEHCGDDENAILFYLRGVRVHCYQGTKQTTSAGFIYHLNAEISHNSESAFFIDSKWYKVKDVFVKTLITQTESIFKNFKLPNGILYEPWDLQSGTNALIDEGVYNLKYNGKTNYIVMDKILPDNIEVCDILHILPTEIYLIHVKHSFTARVRELTNQILISARRLSEAIASKNNAYFEQMFKQIESNKRNINNLSELEFLDLFYKKKVTYVFATASQFSSDLMIEGNVNKYRSNIARFSLTTCSSEMRNQYFDMLTYQIKRT
ncbi:sporadically distributed protein, TIGR04141 family [Pedobacter sp. ok626]|uniref:DUF6119 family protein n=1 Tax=Pedobacter sp. ok626 TaxID=1761882 RepID=UPI0008895B3E|nr:DUF6119 family protein [Pedobacter sp. ok626]SDK59047.1 sporadically distributed protein, TIGR04141 family [Pedobacter sp. ok626]